MNRIELTRALTRSITALFIGVVLAACSGGGDVASTSTPAPNTLSGVAAVGYPIVNATVNVVCATGTASANTSDTGAWQVSTAGLTLPCAVQVSGGSINGAPNTAIYHSLAVSMGIVNITPLTDLIVANFAQRPDPDVWFSGLTSTPTALARIAIALEIETALANLRTALGLRTALNELTSLDTTNPITTAFTPAAGDAGDDLLVALTEAMTTTGVTHAALLGNASAPSFTPPVAGLGTAFKTTFAGTVSGGAKPPVTGLTTTTGDGQATISWNPVAGATSYKLYMNTAAGISLTNPANMHHSSVSSPFVHTGLTNGTTYYFVVTAVNKNGESIASAEVSATPQALPLPVVTLTAAPSSIASGATSTLSWSSTNSVLCNSPGGGGTGTTGTFTTPPLTATTTYTVTCTGAGGTASQSATVTVSAAATGSWSLTGSLSVGRVSHTATLLPNGKVLVVGGIGGTGGALSSAEIYDPATGSWSVTGSLATGRVWHTATLLSNGKVLVTGGFNTAGVGAILAGAELYDPTTGSWSAAGSMIKTRIQHLALLLSNGKVLVVGGAINGVGVSDFSSAELYDPTTGSWSITGSLVIGRQFPTATLLANGKVLMTGGTCGFDFGCGPLGGFAAVSELYDPVTGTWSQTGALATARSLHTATLLPGGKVLVAGGGGAAGLLSNIEMYDPDTGLWTTAGGLTTGRWIHTATLLLSGKVLVAGGAGAGTGAAANLFSAELYDPVTGISSATGNSVVAHGANPATLLPNGKVLMAGGSNGTPFATTELYW